MDAIDLGEKPISKLLSPPDKPDMPEEPRYPRVTLRGGPELHKIPTTGKSVIHHKVVGRHMEEMHGDKSHSIELELRKIKPVGQSRSASGADADAMQKLMDEKDSEDKDEKK